MSTLGYIQVRAYTSRARIPLEDVSVAITDQNGKLLGLRLTDENGIARAVEVTVPDLKESQAPNPGEAPFTTVNLTAKRNQYESVESKGVQVFADTVTLQELAMIPLSELPGRFDKTEEFDTPPQNL